MTLRVAGAVAILRDLWREGHEDSVDHSESVRLVCDALEAAERRASEAEAALRERETRPSHCMRDVDGEPVCGECILYVMHDNVAEVTCADCLRHTLRETEAASAAMREALEDAALHCVCCAQTPRKAQKCVRQPQDALRPTAGAALVAEVREARTLAEGWRLETLETRESTARVRAQRDAALQLLRAALPWVNGVPAGFDGDHNSEDVAAAKKLVGDIEAALDGREVGGG